MHDAEVACLKTDTLGQALAPTSEAEGVPALPLPNGETAGRLLAPAWQRHEPSPSAPPLNDGGAQGRTARAIRALSVQTAVVCRVNHSSSPAREDGGLESSADIAEPSTLTGRPAPLLARVPSSFGQNRQHQAAPVLEGAASRAAG